MPHDTGLIIALAAAFGLAFVMGLLASRLRLPPLVGYLAAGVLIGPFTRGTSRTRGWRRSSPKLVSSC